MAINLGETSLVAEESLNQLAEIDLAAINAADLRSARIQVGLVFTGFGALAMVFRLLYLSTLHPDLSPGQQVQRYWHQYIWFVCLGVVGLFMLGREAMRPPDGAAKRCVHPMEPRSDASTRLRDRGSGNYYGFHAWLLYSCK